MAFLKAYRYRYGLCVIAHRQNERPGAVPGCEMAELSGLLSFRPRCRARSRNTCGRGPLPACLARIVVHVIGPLSLGVSPLLPTGRQGRLARGLSLAHGRPARAAASAGRCSPASATAARSTSPRSCVCWRGCWELLGRRCVGDAASRPDSRPRTGACSRLGLLSRRDLSGLVRERGPGARDGGEEGRGRILAYIEVEVLMQPQHIQPIRIQIGCRELLRHRRDLRGRGVNANVAEQVLELITFHTVVLVRERIQHETQRTKWIRRVACAKNGGEGSDDGVGIGHNIRLVDVAGDAEPDALASTLALQRVFLRLHLCPHVLLF
mmetsp:Transcript_32198/g.74382  ORF Transcript_32198/g.74382 Transcript_32198/m.74382 type:complete len:323 (-) Transcript_32198:6788-7756(-)